jgi:hypothetical protein
MCFKVTNVTVQISCCNILVFCTFWPRRTVVAFGGEEREVERYDQKGELAHSLTCFFFADLLYTLLCNFLSYNCVTDHNQSL